jgi:hypothetical protein
LNWSFFFFLFSFFSFLCLGEGPINFILPQTSTSNVPIAPCGPKFKYWSLLTYNLRCTHWQGRNALVDRGWSSLSHNWPQSRGRRCRFNSYWGHSVVDLWFFLPVKVCLRSPQTCRWHIIHDALTELMPLWIMVNHLHSVQLWQKLWR